MPCSAVIHHGSMDDISTAVINHDTTRVCAELQVRFNKGPMTVDWVDSPDCKARMDSLDLTDWVEVVAYKDFLDY